MSDNTPRIPGIRRLLDPTEVENAYDEGRAEGAELCRALEKHLETIEKMAENTAIDQCIKIVKRGGCVDSRVGDMLALKNNPKEEQK